MTAVVLLMASQKAKVQQSGISILGGRDNIHVEFVVKEKMLSGKRPYTTGDDRATLCWLIRDGK